MLKLKNLTQKLLQSYPEKHHLSQKNNKSSTKSMHKAILDEKQVIILTKWLDQLNREQLITFTDQNDIVIMPGGKNDQAQQIFLNHNDVKVYMETRIRGDKEQDKTDIISMADIARMLLKFGYVNESSGQLSFMAQTMTADSNELTWLISIVRDVQPDPNNNGTHVKLFDGERTQLLHIPYEHMAPTSDTRSVATYLFQNGQVRYDIDTGTYAYRYMEPDILLDEKSKSPERISQHHLLAFHIRQIHVDEQKRRIEVEFLHEPNHHLALPNRWYPRIFSHLFDRNYIIDILLANGGIIDQDTFIFKNYVYSLQQPRAMITTSPLAPPSAIKSANLSVRQKYEFICRYIDLIIEKDGVKQNEKTRSLVLQNPSDGRQLYFTPEHSEFIRENQFRRQDVIQVLVNDGQIKQDEAAHWVLYYNNQCVQLPSSLRPSSIVTTQGRGDLSSALHKRVRFSTQEISRPITATTPDAEAKFRQQYHRIIDYMYRHGLVTWDKDSKLIRLHFTDQTLLLPLNHLRSIVDPNVVSSSSTNEGVLPFNSHKLSEWLLNNSYIKHDAH